MNPIVLIYAFDDELDESWETRSRGKYQGTSIKPGDSQSDTIELSPKSFRNLDIEKSLRLVLNSTDYGFIKAVSKKVTIS